MTSRPGNQAMLAAALAYARRGWPVFPCRPGRKEPDTAHGFKDATTDPERITAWWTAVPGRNVAIATGAPGPDVLDVDVRPGGSGYPALDRLQRAGLLQGPVAAVVTPSGGMHLYYPGTSQASGRLPECHLDFKATGGYVLAPPSAVSGRPYRLIRHQPGRVVQAAGGRLDWAAAIALLEPRQPHPQAGAAVRPGRYRPAGRVGRPATRRQPERGPVLGRLPRRRNRAPRRSRRSGRGSADRRAARAGGHPDHRLRAPQRRTRAAGPLMASVMPSPELNTIPRR